MAKHLLLVSLVFLMASCNTGLKTDQTLLDTEAVEKATTGGIEVTFHGESCDVDAPDILPVGKYSFTLNNLSESTSLNLYVAKITDGHSYQDLLDFQNSPGEYFPKPDWLIYAKKIGSVDPSTGQVSYKITLEPGEHAIYVWSRLLWFCKPIMVVDPSTG